jgi:NAD(P)-dependent dehydrogenase (short-subunit alcohol dehydrogenase family)
MGKLDGKVAVITGATSGMALSASYAATESIAEWGSQTYHCA